jgi:hypothetical protein
VDIKIVKTSGMYLMASTWKDMNTDDGIEEC